MKSLVTAAFLLLVATQSGAEEELSAEKTTGTAPGNASGAEQEATQESRWRLGFAFGYGLRTNPLVQSDDIPIVIDIDIGWFGNRFFFDIGIQRIIFPEEWADQKDPVTWVTAEYTKAIEAFVREDPSQYWWVHRRWKSKPGDRRRRKSTSR